MYDTIGAQLHHIEPYYDQLFDVIAALRSPYLKQRKDIKEPSLTVKHRGFNLTLTKKALYLSGSLPQFLYGTNQHNFTLVEAGQAIQALSEFLTVDVSSAKVTRVDLAYNFEMQHPVGSYFRSLSHKQYTKRITYANETLGFKGSEATLNFYNKEKQLRDKRKAIAPENLNKHLLRYEVQFKRNLKKVLDFATLTVADLLDEAVYNHLKHVWYEQYRSIDKLFYESPSEQPCRNWSELQQYMLMDYLKLRGAEEVFAKIDRDFPTKYRVKSDCKQRIKALLSLNEHQQVNDSVQELEDKMYDALVNAA